MGQGNRKGFTEGTVSVCLCLKVQWGMEGTEKQRYHVRKYCSIAQGRAVKY
jgi:hypothetical protein